MIARRIKELRKEKSWSQAQLARRLYVTRNAVNLWEKGLSMPSPPLLVALAKEFSVSVDDILGIEHMKSIDVRGLGMRDIAILAELADRMRGGIDESGCSPNSIEDSGAL